MSDKQKFLSPKRIMSVAEFAEYILEQYAQEVHKLEQEIRQMQNKKRR